MLLSRLGRTGVVEALKPMTTSYVGVRNMATLKELKTRISSTKNIKKITKSMKMIASTKLVRAQRAMNQARTYHDGVKMFEEHHETPKEEGKSLYIACSSDKGLCGGIHSSMSKHIRGEAKGNSNAMVISIGDKSKAQLQRFVPDNMVMHFTGIGSRGLTFLESCEVVSEILKADYKPASVKLVYNYFKSVISYETEELNVATPEGLAKADLAVYEYDDGDLQSLAEFNMANKLFCAMSDGYASETASKMTAMDNATRNAGDMIDKLTTVYNRTRQAVITTELVDIITGASAL